MNAASNVNAIVSGIEAAVTIRDHDIHHEVTIVLSGERRRKVYWRL